MDNFAPNLRSIGHSNHPLEHFQGLLRRHEMTAVVDVRSRPYSRFAPQVRKDRLQRSLPEAGIAYHWFGLDMGGKPARAAPEHTRLDYRGRIAQPGFELLTVTESIEPPAGLGVVVTDAVMEVFGGYA